MANYNDKQRKAMAKKGQALSDGSFPIADEADLTSAVAAFGRAGDKAAAKQHIIKRATELGLQKSLPEGWAKAKEAATNVVATAEALVQGSTDSDLNRIRESFCSTWPSMRTGDSYIPGPWVRDIFLSENYLVCDDKGHLYRVDFAEKDGVISFTERMAWKEVYLTYTPAEGATTESRRYSETPPAAQPRVSAFRESMGLAESTVDEEKLTVRGVTLIKAGFSTNTDKQGRQRLYPAEVLKRDGPKVFEGAHVYVNHPGKKEEENRPEGDALGVMGWYENVKFDEATQSLKGDQVFVERATVKNELWPIIKAAVERKPDLVELSINALGTARIGESDGKKAVIIEGLSRGDRPARVDIVTRGAAGGNYQGALLASDDSDLTDDLLAALPFEQWRESHSDYVERLKAEWKTVRETEALKEARTALTTLQEKFDATSEQLRAAGADLLKYQRGDAADRLLAKSALPHPLRTEVRKALLECADETAMQAVIESEQKKFKLAPKPPVQVTGAGQRATSTPKPVTEVKPVNPVARAMGIVEGSGPRRGESAEAYRVRKLQEESQQAVN